VLELWLEGSEVLFEGIYDGERFRGSAPLSDFDAGNDAPFCFGWVALVCVGALVVLAASGSGCAILEGCVPPPVPVTPEGGGGVPETGGDGDGDGDGDGSTGGGDSD
jgi:hypothetical protein